MSDSVLGMLFGFLTLSEVMDCACVCWQFATVCFDQPNLHLTGLKLRLARVRPHSVTFVHLDMPIDLTALGDFFEKCSNLRKCCLKLESDGRQLKLPGLAQRRSMPNLRELTVSESCFDAATRRKSQLSHWAISTLVNRHSLCYLTVWVKWISLKFVESLGTLTSLRVFNSAFDEIADAVRDREIFHHALDEITLASNVLLPLGFCRARVLSFGGLTRGGDLELPNCVEELQLVGQITARSMVRSLTSRRLTSLKLVAVYLDLSLVSKIPLRFNSLEEPQVPSSWLSAGVDLLLTCAKVLTILVRCECEMQVQDAPRCKGCSDVIDVAGDLKPGRIKVIQKHRMRDLTREALNPRPSD